MARGGGAPPYSSWTDASVIPTLPARERRGFAAPTRSNSTCAFAARRSERGRTLRKTRRTLEDDAIANPSRRASLSLRPRGVVRRPGRGTLLRARATGRGVVRDGGLVTGRETLSPATPALPRPSPAHHVPHEFRHEFDVHTRPPQLPWSWQRPHLRDCCMHSSEQPRRSLPSRQLVVLLLFVVAQRGDDRSRRLSRRRKHGGRMRHLEKPCLLLRRRSCRRP